MTSCSSVPQGKLPIQMRRISGSLPGGGPYSGGGPGPGGPL